jgi:hypothetical protein
MRLTGATMVVVPFADTIVLNARILVNAQAEEIVNNRIKDIIFYKSDESNSLGNNL